MDYLTVSSYLRTYKWQSFNEHESRATVVEIRSLSKMCNVRLYSIVKNNVVCERYDLKEVVPKIEKGMIEVVERWFEHLKRMNERRKSQD